MRNWVFTLRFFWPKVLHFMYKVKQKRDEKQCSLKGIAHSLKVLFLFVPDLSLGLVERIWSWYEKDLFSYDFF